MLTNEPIDKQSPSVKYFFDSKKDLTRGDAWHKINVGQKLNNSFLNSKVDHRTSSVMSTSKAAAMAGFNYGISREERFDK